MLNNLFHSVIPACFWRESSVFVFDSRQSLTARGGEPLDSRQKRAGMTMTMVVEV
jgi:hypothetical protein